MNQRKKGQEPDSPPDEKAQNSPVGDAPHRLYGAGWAGQGSNLRRPACKASALPLSYPPKVPASMTPHTLPVQPGHSPPP